MRHSLHLTTCTRLLSDVTLRRITSRLLTLRSSDWMNHSTCWKEHTNPATRKCCGWESILNSIHCTVIRVTRTCCASWTIDSLPSLRLPDSCAKIRSRLQYCLSEF